jgi:hypothetical protein
VLATVAWIAIMAAAVVWEVLCHFSTRWTSLTALASRLWLTPVGRVAYVAIWSFVAWHVFTRYTLPA